MSEMGWGGVVVYNAQTLGICRQSGAEGWHQLQLLRIAGEARRAADRDQVTGRLEARKGPAA